MARIARSVRRNVQHHSLSPDPRHIGNRNSLGLLGFAPSEWKNMSRLEISCDKWVCARIECRPGVQWQLVTMSWAGLVRRCTGYCAKPNIVMDSQALGCFCGETSTCVYLRMLGSAGSNKSQVWWHALVNRFRLCRAWTKARRVKAETYKVATKENEGKGRHFDQL